MTRITDLLFPEPSADPIIAQVEALRMTVAAFAGIGLALIVNGILGISSPLTVYIFAGVPTLVFVSRFISKARGWSHD